MLSRNKKLKKVSQKLGVEATTISRRILRLEEKLGAKLFFRSNNNYVLTEDGHKLLPHSEQMETEAMNIKEVFSNKDINLTGKVRISVPEGLGIEIFTKYLKNFLKTNNELEIELVADSKFRNLTSKEVDISIGLSQPKSNKLKSWKLSNYKIQLYGSKSYIKENQIIKYVSDLSNHKFVSYIDDMIDFPELKYLQETIANAKIVFRSNNLQAQLNAVKQGVGIAFLHSFIAKNEKELDVILKENINLTREYWIIIHEDLINLKRIKVAVDFIINVFDNEKTNIVN
tara:strand:- start:6602 stop:7459 length:858 start_codon:yes stop_codon:yes gene_type:complete